MAILSRKIVCNHNKLILLLFSVKKNLDAKLINVPPTQEIVADSIRSVNSEHLNKFIILFGTVVRTGNVHSRELVKDFKCKQCEKEF